MSSPSRLTATYIVAIMSILISRMLGVPQFAGSAAVIWLIVLETLTMALSILLPSANSSCTIE